MSSLAGMQTLRKPFGKIKDVAPVPDLIEIQSKSFNDFVQLDMLSSERELIGLQKVLNDIFPIDYNDKMALEFVSYELGNWACICGKLSGIENRYSWHCTGCKKSDCSRLDQQGQCSGCQKNSARYKVCGNCLSRVIIQTPMNLEEYRSSGQTFSMPLKVKVQLTSWDHSNDGQKLIRDIKEQDIFFADIPIMVDIFQENGQFKVGSLGTFLINGVDRVVVSQLHRSPGVVFAQSKKVKDSRGKPYYVARIIPMRGSWLDFEFDTSDILYVRIDKKKKVLATTFLQALGIKRQDIISLFYAAEKISIEDGIAYKLVNSDLVGFRLEKSMLPENMHALYAGRRVNADIVNALLKADIKKIPLRKEDLLNRVFFNDVIHPSSNELLVAANQTCTYDILERLHNVNLPLLVDFITSSGFVLQPTIALTLNHDKCFSQEEALKDVHVKLWPGDSSSIREIKERFEGMLFNNRLYDLTLVGRIRMNRKLGLNVADTTHVLTLEDILATIRSLVNLCEKGQGELDDIDHLGNRRVRLVGELLTNQLYLGFLRVERIVRERFRMHESHGTLMPQDFLNVKPISATLREFFGMGQLSQFMDQTNPLSEIAHKRRLSALGPGGVLKDRATYEIRDVHTSHYGRICPIETPEGQTVGLISSLATYAMVDDLGFIQTGYKPVVQGIAQDSVVFFDAFEESNKYIAQADAMSKHKAHTNDKIVARYENEFMYIDRDRVEYVDLSPKQLVSVSTALIPFLEHDDASRALMGSNMQRQAVPLIRCAQPIVGTGMEQEICKSSGAVLTAKKAGIVDYVSSEKIIIRADQNQFRNTEEWLSQGVDVYYLRKFQRSSYSTWIHHSPLVRVGDHVEQGAVLTDGPAIKDGELALGSNLLVAFMPWHGYNFEDAIVLSKRLVAEDVLTSVHIDEYIVDARDTKLGPEEITRDIPNMSEIALESLDDEGIIKIGSRVKAGDILVGKVTLKGDIQFSPEEKLLRAIFGEKSREVRDTSLRVPPGIEGTVVDIKVFSRSGVRKDKRYKDVVSLQSEKLEKEFSLYQDSLGRIMFAKIKEAVQEDNDSSYSALLKKIEESHTFNEQSINELLSTKVGSKKTNSGMSALKSAYENQLRIIDGLKQEKINRLKKGDVLPSGVIKMVKVYIASKRTVSVGDKIAGRHGNKGVVSVILPREDMPYLSDGTPVDIVLNPIGVPSRMNVGQILETILGFIGYTIGKDMKQALIDKSLVSITQQLSTVYGQDIIDAYHKAHGDEGIYLLAKKTAENGALFSTPVFDGAHYEHDLQPLLAQYNLPSTGSFKLRDGRTGQDFDQDVTMGSIYTMKLNHMADDKLHARSVGPYSLVTQQPLGGKAQMGGQRFGEMEVWALEAYGAAYTLRELLTHKSDDLNGRPKVYDAIVRNEPIPEPGLPESFNVLIKELQSLGLQVELSKSGKEEISE